MPKPTPPMTAPARYSVLESTAADETINAVPAASATEPALAPIHGAVRPNTSWPAAADPASTTIPMPARTALVVSNSRTPSPGPSEKNRPPIDHEARTASAASRKGCRALAGTLGRATVSRRRRRPSTGSGMKYAPANAIAKSIKRTTYGRVLRRVAELHER